MTSEDLCRLCVSRCQDFKRLFHENGQENNAYLLMVKYFDSSYFNAELAKQSSVICFQCWQHIYDFNTFQQSVLKAQQKLLQSNQATANVYIKSEPGPQHEMDMANSPINIKLEKPDVIDDENYRADVIIPDTYKTALAEDDSMSEMGESEYNFSSDEEASTTYSEDEATKSAFREEPSSSNVFKKQKELERLQESDEIIARWKPFLACLMCSEPCATLTILQQHFRQEHPQADCYVLCCRRRLKDRFKIEQHMKHHINPNSFQCETCGEHFRCRSSLASHKKKHHFGQKRSSAHPVRKSTKKSDEFIAEWKPNLDCALCNVKRPTYTRLQEHFSEEHPLDQPYISCCGRKLSGRHRIEEHVQVHMDPNAFKCDKCDKCFKMRWHLRNHIRRLHSEEKDKAKQINEKKCQYLSKMGNQHDELIAQWKPLLECVVCNESFPNFSLLEKHFRPSHPNDEFYISCCQLKLNRPYRVLDHARYHADPNAFKCDECGKLHRNKNALSSHIKAQHPDIKV